MNQETRFAQKGIILNKSLDSILVIKYLKSKYLPQKLEGKLALPGGQSDFAEEPDEAFKREVKEETGLNIIPSEMIYPWTWVYEKKDKMKQIIAIARVGIEHSGVLHPHGKDEEEVKISKPFWIPLQNIQKEAFVIDEQPAIQELMNRIEANNTFQNKIQSDINNFKEHIFIRLYKQYGIDLNEDFFGLYDSYPVTPGHMIVVPRRQVLSLLDLNSEQWSSLQDAITKAVRIIQDDDLQEVYETKIRENYIPDESSARFIDQAIEFIKQSKTKPSDFNHGINDGRHAGRTIDWLHWHIIPRYQGDVENPTGGVRNTIPGKGDYRADS